MIRAILACVTVLTVGCGNVSSADPTGSGGAAGEAGAAGELAGHSGAAGDGDAGKGGAIGGAAGLGGVVATGGHDAHGGEGGQGGAGGQSGGLPICPRIGSYVDQLTPHCFDCFDSTNVSIAGPCQVSDVDAARSSYRAPLYCVTPAHQSGALPAVCN